MVGRLALALLLALLAAPLVGRADVTVFHSPGDNGGTPGLVAALPIGGSGDVALYFAPRAGETLLGWQLTLVASGGVSVTGFAAEPGVTANVSTARVDAVGGAPLAGESAPTRIGTVSLAAASAGELQVTGSFVEASLAKLAMASTVVGEASRTIVCGDADASGGVSAADVTAIAGILGGEPTAGTCDADGDATCTVRDMTRVQLHLQSLTALDCP